MNMFNDSVIDNLIQSAYNDDDDDVDDDNKLPPNDLGFDDSGCEDLLNFDNSKLFQSCEINDSDIGDILPPPPPPMFDLPDFEDFGGF